jgi:hypothetical protein
MRSAVDHEGLGPTACKPLTAVVALRETDRPIGEGFDDSPLAAAVQLTRVRQPSGRPVRSSTNLSATLYGVVTCLPCVRDKCSGPVATTIAAAVTTLRAT